ncbi:MAG TPA: hypothetical protein EYP24_00635 [bacterium (Candidatus Stahlbacteria)]|nr:hypothetical protein [Candidatus Stahlbacteria bacterium]
MIKKFTTDVETPFIYDSSGIYTQEDPSKIDQIGTMLLQTLETLGIDGVDLLEVVGNKRSVAMRVKQDLIIGNLTTGRVDELASRLDELEATLKAEKVEEEVEEAIVNLKELSRKVNMILTEFLGDFAPRVYRNQLKKLKLEEGELPLKKMKDLIYALGDAANLMIGPTQSQEMTDRLLMLIK